MYRLIKFERNGFLQHFYLIQSFLLHSVLRFQLFELLNDFVHIITTTTKDASTTVKTRVKLQIFKDTIGRHDETTIKEEDVCGCRTKLARFLDYNSSSKPQIDS